MIKLSCSIISGDTTCMLDTCKMYINPLRKSHLLNSEGNSKKRKHSSLMIHRTSTMCPKIRLTLRMCHPCENKSRLINYGILLTVTIYFAFVYYELHLKK